MSRAPVNHTRCVSLQADFTNTMEVHGVVVVTMDYVTSFQVFYQLLEVPVFATITEFWREPNDGAGNINMAIDVLGKIIADRTGLSLV